ncbi:hypothetical protein DF223_13470 [Mycetocola zhujimingii]|uniref:Uncharacterized protein n=1 Tax=Mycetocola zhujimingii TaxID=2079792 RepID=A0A2U1TAV8_9MICO|nr:hypothetical protein DF223_13470 [Mycetocola zhujimingii]
MCDAQQVPKTRRPSLAEIAAELRAAPKRETAPDPVTPGRFDRGGHLIDLQGNVLRREGKLTAQEAVALMRSGAAVAYEGCGCGGGCDPAWLDEAELAALATAGNPRTDTRSSQPAWIDLWTGGFNDTVSLVLLNGEATWGRVIPRRH